jgi:AcrR family transcriptional regulator
VIGVSTTERLRLESQAERRRAHLLTVAAHLVVTEGVDAVSHASVGELAGCARTLVYRYFPRREDLLYALLTAFDDDLATRLPVEGSVAGIAALKDAKPERMPAPTRAMVESLWKPEDWQDSVLEFRLAVIILTRDSRLRAVIGEHGTEHQWLIEERVTAPLRRFGLSETEVEIVLDAMLSAQHHVTKAALAREITREQAMELLFRVSLHAVQTFTR